MEYHNIGGKIVAFHVLRRKTDDLFDNIYCDLCNDFSELTGQSTIRCSKCGSQLCKSCLEKSSHVGFGRVKTWKIVC